MAEKTNVYLYGALDANVADSYAAKEYMDSLGIEYTHLFYSDSSQFQKVLDPVSTWFKDKKITAFPFVIWDENNERCGEQGLAAIKAVKFIETPEKPKK